MRFTAIRRAAATRADPGETPRRLTRPPVPRGHDRAHATEAKGPARGARAWSFGVGGLPAFQLRDAGLQAGERRLLSGQGGLLV